MSASRQSLWARVGGWLAAGVVAATLAGCATGGNMGTDPLPSWNDGASKQAIVDFVRDVTKEGSPNYVAPSQRIATFDNDGTLWVEQPIYTQFALMIAQLKAAKPRPEWVNNPTYKALMADDMKTAMAGGEKALLGLLFQANSGMSVDDYDKAIRQWFATARHPTLKRPYTELVYQPQLELLKYLRANGFKTFIVSGGTMEAMRPWAEEVYGIPPEQVVGSSQTIKYDVATGKLMREPSLFFLDDGPGKPVGINLHIGQRPILAFGNSDGDMHMLKYTTDGPGRRLGLIVHHDDAQREFAYDRQSSMGKLDKALDQAPANKWIVVSMKKDWKQVFPSAK
ncbi:HAD family hydrolase [Variovorax dokdonensis]|uniref:HAD family hydrolase n=1 Tax=Variovorax dokdonensis TaxID=344883 RepID=A0ABT7NGW9_9BURK|nr:HAD family hydrolase [Variovorax dokdonensis]MDM0047205.1 HAD family hydrolase [Variovorax dokdonensis]